MRVRFFTPSLNFLRKVCNVDLICIYVIVSMPQIQEDMQAAEARPQSYRMSRASRRAVVGRIDDVTERQFDVS